LAYREEEVYNPDGPHTEEGREEGGREGGREGEVLTFSYKLRRAK